MRIRSISFSAAPVLLAVVLSVLPGCQGPITNMPTASQSTNSAPCTMKFSGAFAATAPCNALCMKTSTASANGNQDITSITITLAGASPDVTAALIQIELQGTPAATTYPNGNTPVYAATVTRIVNGSPSLWVVSQQSKTGALTLSFSNVQAVQGVTAQGTNSAQTLTQYNIHGTAQATLIAPPTPSAPGTSTVAAPLTMAVTF